MQAQEFYAEIVRREEEIAELKAELKEAIESFASSNNLTSQGIKKGIKEYKEFIKDESLYRVVTEDAHTLFAAMTEYKGEL